MKLYSEFTAVASLLLGLSFGVQGVVAEDSKEVVKPVENEVDNKKELSALMKAKDWEGLKKFANKMDDHDRMKPMWLINSASKRGEWGELIALRVDAKKGRFGDAVTADFVDNQIAKLAKITDGAKKYADVALADLKPIKDDMNTLQSYSYHFVKARLSFMAGDKAAAASELVKAKKFVMLLEKEKTKKFYMMVVDGGIEKVAEGSFPDLSELTKGFFKK